MPSRQTAKSRNTQIPLSARIVSMADVYDALISSKVCKDGMVHDDAVATIFGERDAHFDPDVVDAFVEVHPEFSQIAQRYADTEADTGLGVDATIITMIMTKLPLCALALLT